MALLIHTEYASRESDEGRRGDTAWLLWGLVMRLAQAVRIGVKMNEG